MGVWVQAYCRGHYPRTFKALRKTQRVSLTNPSCQPSEVEGLALRFEGVPVKVGASMRVTITWCQG